MATLTSTTLPPFSLLGLKYGYIMHEFLDLVGGRDRLQGKTTKEVKDLLLPVTAATGGSLCEVLLEKQGRADVVAQATWFVSHAWKYVFLDVMEAVGIFLEKEYGGAENASDVVIWFDLFSNSQHHVSERPFEWWQGTFTNAIRTLGNVLMILQPWDDPVTLTRAWCVFEVYACESTSSRFEVSMTHAEEKRFLESIENNSFRSFFDMLTRVKSERSESFSAADRERIHDAVRRLIPHGFTHLDSMIFRVMEKWITRTVKERLDTAVAIVGQLSSASEEELSNARDDMLFWQNAMCMVYYTQGKHIEALEYAQMSVATSMELFGSQHESTLECEVTMSRCYLSLGDTVLAEQTLLKCLGTSELVYGVDSQETIELVQSLADNYKHAHNNVQAEIYYRRCLDGRERLHGADHADTILCAAELVHICKKLGKLETAQMLSSQYIDKHTHSSVKVLNNNFGTHEVPQLATDTSQAILYLTQGRYPLAEPLLLKCYEETERMFGPDNPRTLQLETALADCYYQLGDKDMAGTWLEKCLTHYTDDNDNNTSSSKNSRKTGHEAAAVMLRLASLFASQSKFQQAEPLFQKCLAHHEETMADNPDGSPSPDTHDLIEVCARLASTYYAQRRSVEAEPLFERCLAFYDSHNPPLPPLPPVHTDNQAQLPAVEQTVLKNNMTSSLYSTSRLRHVGTKTGNDVHNSHNEALAALRSTSSQSASLALASSEGRKYEKETIDVVNRLALTYFSLQKYSEAESLFVRNLHTQELARGPDQPDTNEVMQTVKYLAITYVAQHNYEAAKPVYERLLADCERLLGRQHAETVKIRSELEKLNHHA
jgi:tetratricopeptide (TPR) repeat protein